MRQDAGAVGQNANVQAVAASDFLMATTVDRNSPETFSYPILEADEW